MEKMGIRKKEKGNWERHTEFNRTFSKVQAVRYLSREHWDSSNLELKKQNSSSEEAERGIPESPWPMNLP